MFAKDPRVRVTAISDIYDDQIEAARAEVSGAKDARVYRDYRELLGSAEVDAVYIATPVYAHPEHFEAAVAARKRIYCEKPAGTDIEGVARTLLGAYCSGGGVGRKTRRRTGPGREWNGGCGREGSEAGRLRSGRIYREPSQRSHPRGV
jgi:hypothetical protein